MLTASYQQNNDYNIANVRPYELDYNSVLQEAATKQQYWLQGVAKVQDAWKAVDDLDPLNPINKQNLDNFRQKSKVEIDKLSKEDLSQGDVISKVNDIFKPLYDSNNPLSRSLLVDSEINKHYKSQMNSIEKYKIKNKGEEYSLDNELYLRDKYNEYVQKASSSNPDTPEVFEELWQKRGSYTPYYNYNEDIKEGLKNCKDNSNSIQTPVNNSGYMYSETVTGRTSEEMARCIGAALSPKALNQMNIEAYVKYGKNYEALQNDLRINIEEDRKSNLSNIGRLQADLLNDKFSPSEKEQISKQIQMLSKSNDELSKMDIDFSDVSYIEKNYEQLANSSFFNKKLASLGQAYEHISTSKKYMPDNVQLLNQKMQFEANQASIKMQFEANESALDRAFTAEQKDLDRKKDILVASMKEGNSSNNFDNPLGIDVDNAPNIEILNTDETVKERTKADFIKEGSELLNTNKELRNQILDLSNQLTSATETIFPDSKQLPNQTKEEWEKNLIDNLDRSKVSDPHLKQLLEDYDTNMLLINNHNTVQERINMENASKVDVLKNKQIEVRFTNGDKRNLSAKDLENNFKTIVKDNGTTKQYFTIYTDPKTKKQYQVENGSTVRSNYKDIENQLTALEEEAYKTNLLDIHKGLDITQANSQKNNPIRTNISSRLSGISTDADDPSKTLKYDDIKLISTDRYGKVIVAIPGLSLEQIKSIYPTAKEYQKGTGQYVIENDNWKLSKDSHYVNKVFSNSLESLKQNYNKTPANYNGYSELYIVNNYKGKWNIYTTPSLINKGTLFVVNTKTGDKFAVDNISKAVDILMNQK